MLSPSSVSLMVTSSRDSCNQNQGFYYYLFQVGKCGFIVCRDLQEKIIRTHIDVLHVSDLTPDSVKLLSRLTDVVTVLKEMNS